MASPGPTQGRSCWGGELAGGQGESVASREGMPTREGQLEQSLLQLTHAEPLLSWAPRLGSRASTDSSGACIPPSTAWECCRKGQDRTFGSRGRNKVILLSSHPRSAGKVTLVPTVLQTLAHPPDQREQVC